MADFVDRVTLHAAGGNGGNGVASIKREKFKPLAGPDGGDGGNGGSVILEVSPQETTLLSYHRSPHRRADSGTAGMGDFRQGKNGADIVLPVPDGTVVKSMSGELLADLTGAGARFVVAEGGRGGLGNAALASKARKAPGFALLGEPGEERDVVLELKSVADVALVGFPSAGKSSLIAALSSARPKIADYPFTTLVPNLGVLSAGDTRYTGEDLDWTSCATSNDVRSSSTCSTRLPSRRIVSPLRTCASSRRSLRPTRETSLRSRAMFRSCSARASSC